MFEQSRKSRNTMRRSWIVVCINDEGIVCFSLRALNCLIFALNNCFRHELRKVGENKSHLNSLNNWWITSRSWPVWGCRLIWMEKIMLFFAFKFISKTPISARLPFTRHRNPTLRVPNLVPYKSAPLALYLYWWLVSTNQQL